MAIFYVDGQSVGNEQRAMSRIAKIAFVYHPADATAPSIQESKVYFKDIGDKTNNEAEYHALLAALAYLSSGRSGKTIDVKNTKIFSDSKLLVNQVNGDWKVEEARLRQLREKAARAIVALSAKRLIWVPREQNYAGLWLEGKWKAPAEPITWSYH